MSIILLLGKEKFMKTRLEILIPDGESEFAISVLRCLSQAPGIRVHVLSSEMVSMIRFSKHHAGYFSHKAEEGSEAKLQVIQTTAKKTGADIILPVDIPAIRQIGVNRDKFESWVTLSLTPSLESMNLAEDKGRLTRFLMDHDIPSPKTVFLEDGNFSEQALTELTFPVLAKPVSGRGGSGIRLCQDVSELRQYLSSLSEPEKFIVQSFIKGYDMGCSVLCKDGEILALTMQKGILPPYNKFAPPSGVDFFYDEQVYQYIQKLMRALNWSGVANVDMRYDDEEKLPKILEINPRFWGSLNGSLVAGINFPYLACLLGMDEQLPEINYNLNRYIHHKAALKLVLRKLLPGNTETMSIKGTGIQYILADPLPEVAKYLIKIYNKLLGRRTGD